MGKLLEFFDLEACQDLQYIVTKIANNEFLISVQLYCFILDFVLVPYQCITGNKNTTSACVVNSRYMYSLWQSLLKGLNLVFHLSLRCKRMWQK